MIEQSKRSPITNAKTVISRLVENVSKNGGLLLNISPKADGTIPDDQQKLLLEIGRWLDANGDGIYGTHAWKKFGEGEKDEQIYRFTVKNDAMYVFGLKPVADGKANIRSLAANDSLGKVKTVELLGSSSKVTFTQDETGLHLHLPVGIGGDYPFVLKIKGLKL